MFVMALLSLMRPLLQDIREPWRHQGHAVGLRQTASVEQQPVSGRPAVPCSAIMMVAGVPVGLRRAHHSDHRRRRARCCSARLSLANDVFRKRRDGTRREPRRQGQGGWSRQKIHMDIASSISTAASTILVRGAIFFGWMVAFLCSMAVIGLHSDRADLHHRLHALEGPRALACIAPMVFVMTTADLCRVRSALQHSMALDLSRNLVPAGQVHPERLGQRSESEGWG